LMPSGQVNDAQPPESQAGVSRSMKALVIRASMPGHVGHGFEDSGVNPVAGVVFYDGDDSTHLIARLSPREAVRI
jgi:hypothetical protein